MAANGLVGEGCGESCLFAIVEAGRGGGICMELGGTSRGGSITSSQKGATNCIRADGGRAPTPSAPASISQLGSRGWLDRPLEGARGGGDTLHEAAILMHPWHACWASRDLNHPDPWSGQEGNFLVC